jgi:hypothetical protein
LLGIDRLAPGQLGGGRLGSFFRGLESGAGRVGHVDHAARDFQVGQIGIAAAGRHLVEALESMCQQGS